MPRGATADTVRFGLGFMGLLDFFYPKRCVGCGVAGEYLCSSCFSYISFMDGGFCAVCQRSAIGGLTHPVCRGRYEIDGVFASVVYAGVVKRLVYRFKYSPYLLDIRHVLADLFYEGLIQKEGFVRLLDEDRESKGFFVAIPLHKNRMRERGYNQAEVLAKGFVERLNKGSGVENGKVVMGGMLERVKETVAQFGLSKDERSENVNGAFVLGKGWEQRLRGCGVVFLVDDIVTSGATFREVAKVLKKAGVGKVYGVAFAHGQ